MPTAAHLHVALILLAVLGAGIIGGVFFAFSTFVMKALAKRPANEGIAAMQSINIAVINPKFLGVFLGTAVLCVLATLFAWLHGDTPGRMWLLAGGASYFIGTFLVTILCNVPLNNALAKLTPTDPDSAHHWADYVRRWTLWNHVRTLAALVATAAFAMAMR